MIVCWLSLSIVFFFLMELVQVVTSLQNSLLPLRKKCSYSGYFWSAFPRIRTEYKDFQSKLPYSVLMRESVDQKNSKYGHFLTKELYPVTSILLLALCFADLSFGARFPQYLLLTLLKQATQMFLRFLYFDLTSSA